MVTTLHYQVLIVLQLATPESWRTKSANAEERNGTWGQTTKGINNFTFHGKMQTEERNGIWGYTTKGINELVFHLVYFK